MKVVVVAGTGTEVGKTWYTARLAETLRSRGTTAGARKPAQSYDPADDHPLDAEVLADATGEEVVAVCPPERTYEVPLAPPMAAEALSRPVPTIADLVDASELSDPPPTFGFIELAGGVRSPMASDGDGVALVDALAPDGVLLVADAGLGTINAVRLSLEALGGDRPVLVALNRYDASSDLHRRNRQWLADRDGLSVAVDVAGAVAWLEALP